MVSLLQARQAYCQACLALLNKGGAKICPISYGSSRSSSVGMQCSFLLSRVCANVYLVGCVRVCMLHASMRKHRRDASVVASGVNYLRV